MPMDGALALLGVHAAPQGVDASILLSIKSRALEGKEANYFSEGGRLTELKFED